MFYGGCKCFSDYFTKTHKMAISSSFVLLTISMHILRNGYVPNSICIHDKEEFSDGNKYLTGYSKKTHKT